MKKMIANKSFTYRTRRLQAGDVFEIKDRDAKIMTAIGRASPHVEREPVELPKPPAEVVEKVAAASKDELQAKAEALGIDFDKRWGVPKLTAEIEKADAQS